MTFFGLGQAKVYSGVFLASFLFPGKNTRVGSGTLPQGWPLGRGGGGDTLRGRGSPRGNLSHRAGTFRIDLLEGFPNSFPNIAPRVAACLHRVPFTALSSSRGTTATPPPAMPSSREKTRRVCGLPRKTRVEAEGPRAGASRRCPPLVSGFK